MSVEAMKAAREAIRLLMEQEANMSDCDKVLATLDAAIKAAQPEPTSDERIEEAVQRGMRLAWQLGQTYWQQADSESWKQNKMAAGTVRKFDALLAETIAALAAAPKEPK